MDSGQTHIKITFESKFHFIKWSELCLTYFFTFDCIAEIDHSANNPKGDLKGNEHVLPISADLSSAICTGNSCTIFIPLNYDSSEHKKGWVNVRWYHRKKMSWEGEGCEIIARDKIEICMKIGQEVCEPRKVNEGSLKVQETQESIEVWQLKENDRYLSKLAVISKVTGEMVSFCDLEGHELLVEGFQQNFTRAATDNDRGGIDRIKGKL